MIIDTHTHVVSSDKVKHPLDPEARGWSTEVSNDVEDLIAEMDRAGVDAATLVQPNGTTASITPTSATAPTRTHRARCPLVSWTRLHPMPRTSSPTGWTSTA